MLCTDTSVASQPVYSSAHGAIALNRRLVLKQLPSGQFALTVQPLEPNVLAGSSFMITNSQSGYASTCTVTVESPCESDMSNSHVCLASCYINIMTFIYTVF